MRIAPFVFFSLLALYSSAQVEEFKMRQEVESYQYKPQILGETNQRIDIFSKDKSSISNAIFQSDFYKNNGSIYSYNGHPAEVNISSRGFHKPQNTIAIDGVQFQSFSNIFSPHNSFHPQLIDKVEILYGNNSLIYGSQSLGSHTTFYTSKIEMKDSHTFHSFKCGILSASNMLGVQPFLNYNFKNKKITSSTSLVYNYSKDYQIGKNYNQLYTPWGLNSTLNSRDSFQYDNSKIQSLHLSQKFSLNLNPHSELQFYILYSHFNNYNKFELSDNSAGSSLFPMYTVQSSQLLSYLKWMHRPEEQKMYTSLDIAWSYMESAQDHSTSFFSNNMTQRKSVLQINAYKNHNARHVFFYGFAAGFESIKIKDNTQYFTPTFNAPHLTTSAYFKHELRQSDNISWLWGARFGADYTNMYFDYKPINNYSLSTSSIRPNATLSVSWTRHSCESSNYFITWTTTLRNPQMEDYRNSLVDFRFIPNTQLSAEKITELEASVYRKIDDKLELQGAFYGNIILDAIRMKALNDTITAFGTQYVPFTSINLDKIAILGAQIDIKYHFSNLLMAYSQLNIVKGQDLKNSKNLEDITPVYGNLGIKYKSHKWMAHLWTSYNSGATFQNLNSNYLKENSAKLDAFTYGFPAFILVNTSFSYIFSPNLNLSISIENIVDSQYKSYLSTVSGKGRTLMVDLKWGF